jgi:putative oxidoreductase
MFSMFPDGTPGAGLLLLRAAGGALLIVQSAAYFGGQHELTLPVLIGVSLTSVVGVLLLIGFLTRWVALVSAMVGVSCVFSWQPESSVGPLGIPMTAALTVVIAIAVSCLGPGAFSVDARLFGRQEIIIPPVSSKT